MGGTYMGWIELHAVDHCNNNCAWCHNYSPFAPQREYKAAEYFPWIDLLVENQVNFTTLSIMGGEPMLHSDIMQFTFDIMERYPQKHRMMTTNIFWLSREDIKAYKDLWKMLNTISISRYPVITKQLGGDEQIRELLGLLHSFNKDLNIHMPNKYQFNELYFTEEPNEPEVYCGNADCTALLPDGRMARCGAGGYQHFAPQGTITAPFAASRHMFYDLNNFDQASFWLWRNRYPMDACLHCSFGRKNKRRNWKAESGKRMDTTMESAYHLRTAEHLLAMGDTASAVSKLTTLQEKYPDDSACQNLLGVAHHKNGNLPLSMVAFHKAVKLDPNNEPAKKNLAIIRQQMENQ